MLRLTVVILLFWFVTVAVAVHELTQSWYITKFDRADFVMTSTQSVYRLCSSAQLNCFDILQKASLDFLWSLKHEADLSVHAKQYGCGGDKGTPPVGVAPASSKHIDDWTVPTMRRRMVVTQVESASTKTRMKTDAAAFAAPKMP